MIEVKESALIPVESLQTVNEALAFCGSVEVVDIKNQEQYVNANNLFKDLSRYVVLVENERKAVKEPYRQKGIEVDEWFKKPQGALANLKSKLDGAIRAYSRMVEEKRRIEQERLNREAEERRRNAEEAARIEREKAEELRRQAEQASAAEAAKLRAQADKAEARAEVKEQKADTIIAPVAQAFTTRVAGVSTRLNWKCEITNPMEFIKWAIEHQSTNLLMPNPVSCTAWAKSMRQEMTGPGYRIFNDESLTARSR
jgi:hypothetical protein